jgi:CIC family chloride channel protein
MTRQFEILHRHLILFGKKLTERQLMIILAVLTGLLAGLGTYVFEWLLRGIKYALVSWFPIDGAGWLYLVYPAAGIILAALFVRYLIKDNISEGVTRVLYAMSKKSSRIRPHNCYSSIVGGATTIGFGGSVGPEAPIVLTGAAIGSNVGRIMRLNYRNTTLLLGCGAAAALAAIFKAPIAGVIFVLEILMLDISMTAILPLIIAAVSATTLTFILTGFDPVIQIDVLTRFKLENIPLYILLGVACGLMAYYFKAVNRRIGAWFSRMKHQRYKWIAGGITLGVLIFVFPTLYGEGYDSLVELMKGNTGALLNNSLFYRHRDTEWAVILFLGGTLVFKVVAMATTNAAGGIGGTFAPSLFVGAFTGGTMAYLCNTLLGMDLPMISFTLVGMAGVMSGVMNAPLTSIFLIAEISNGYGLFIPLMIAASISFAVGYYFDPYSIYTRKLYEQGEILTHNKDRSVLVFLDLEKLIETDFHSIDEKTTLGDLVKLISHQTRNIFPVLDPRGVLMGVVQLDDLRADMFDPGKYSTPISHYMIQPPDTIMPNEQISSVLDAFELSRAWMLPVVDKSRRYLGFISKSRILAAYRSQLVEISQE